MGDHNGPLTVYREPSRGRALLLGSGATITLYLLAVISLYGIRVLLFKSLIGVGLVVAGFAVLWITVVVVRKSADQVEITDRYHWEKAELAGATLVRNLSATALLPAGEIRETVRHERSEILKLLVEQDRLRAVQRDARRAGRGLRVSEPVRYELDAELGALEARLRDLISVIEVRVGRLESLAAQAVDLVMLDDRRRRASQAAARIRAELQRSDAFTGGEQPTSPASDSVGRAEAVLAAYAELTLGGSGAPVSRVGWS